MERAPKTSRETRRFRPPQGLDALTEANVLLAQDPKSLLENLVFVQELDV